MGAGLEPTRSTERPRAVAFAPLRAPALDPQPFFGGLLPEGAGLERLARETRVASNDLFGLLSEVGADVGGAVTIGEPRPALDPIVIEEDEYDRILEGAAGYIRGTSVGGGGSSATGIQPKVALTWDPQAERWSIGRGSTPSTHLLKPVPVEYAERVSAEAYLNDIARALDLSAHDARVEPAGERLVLVVERYDRIREGSGLRRLHQEDAAQALGLPWAGTTSTRASMPVRTCAASPGSCPTRRSPRHRASGSDCSP
ncbi:HipA domain-containing protein (plasmid) [Microbacterium sp. NIBRBAC000506063]|nr:HipA domain-containing protein [Microbacterium sp. NIBRBAC000506063]